VVGNGPFDLVFVEGSVYTALEYAWEGPPGEFFSKLASFSRLILFDKRGTGLSDRVADFASAAVRMDDKGHTGRVEAIRPRSRGSESFALR
jgi:hypothetical protein